MICYAPRGARALRVASLPTLRKVYNSINYTILFIIMFEILSSRYFMHG